MNHDRIPSELLPVTYETQSLAVANDQPQGSPVLAAHRTLQGRYRWAMGIGLTLAVGGAYIGARLPMPVYRSVGLIDVAPRVKRILYTNEEGGLLPMFDAYVLSEAQTASQRRVVDMAMASDEWRQLGRSNADRDIARFQQSLAVTHPRYSQNIEIAFSDADPNAAMIAVNEVIDAYMKIVRERDTKSGTETEDQLANIRADCNSHLTNISQDILQVTEGLGEAALQASYQRVIDRLNQYESGLRDVDMDIALDKAASEAADGYPSSALTDEMIALKDPSVAELVVRKNAVDDQLSYLLTTEKLGENHDRVRQTRHDLAVAQRAVAARVQQFRASMAGAPEMRAETLRELTMKKKNLEGLHAASSEECKRVAGKLHLLGQLKQEQADYADRLEAAKQRVIALKTESNAQGRITVISRGERPVEPDTDRRVPFAVAGASGGLLAGFASVLLWGLAQAKLRHVVDVDCASNAGRFLGVVPEVADEPLDATTDSAVVADYCVHHIRAMLQLSAYEHNSLAVTMTSPTAESGKTTLAFALGMSFATSGSRTLLIDCDLVGHGLTSVARLLTCEAAARLLRGEPIADHVNSSPTGSRFLSTLVAVRRTSRTDAEVEELTAAVRERAGTGDVAAIQTLRALEALSRTLPADPDAPQRGVLGVLAGRPVQECAIETVVPNLSLLSSAGAQPNDAEHLSRTVLEKLIKECRLHYDTIIIDTGPVLGSIEASFAAATSDAVVMVVARGARRAVVDEALSRIERVGAAVSGVVFNKAQSADVVRSNYASRPQTRAAQVA